ncbi:MAG TPA: ATP-binding protein, partial [Candidatus Krumholzibacteria bacterium]|nr:ATP-binding protein [Candidatus Krumholzibacteria bacterium]
MAILRLTISNQLAELRRMGFALAEFLDDEGVSKSTAHRVKLVVEELVVNVIHHAFDDGAPHAIVLDVRTDAQGVAIMVEDDGKPFDPTAAPSPPLKELLESGKSGGLGVAIIKKVTR